MNAGSDRAKQNSQMPTLDPYPGVNSVAQLVGKSGHHFKEDVTLARHLPMKKLLALKWKGRSVAAAFWETRTGVPERGFQGWQP